MNLERSKVKKIWIIDKDRSQRLTEHFALEEAQCKCNHKDCTFTIVTEKVLILLEESRTALDNSPLVINSWYRCQRHNKEIGGVDKSYHKKGQAVDIKKPYYLNFTDFSNTLKTMWDVVIVYKKDNFCHCHISY